MTIRKYKNTKRILPLIVVIFAFFSCNDTLKVPIETTVMEEGTNLSVEILAELQKRGYDVEFTKEMTPKNKAALIMFQKDHGLPSFCRGSEQVLEFLKTEPVLEGVRERELIRQTQMALRGIGYDVEVTGRINTQTKTALMKFQKDNKLPENGGINGAMLTLKALGVIK